MESIREVFYAGQMAIHLYGKILNYVSLHKKMLIGTKLRSLILGAHVSLNL